MTSSFEHDIIYQEDCIVGMKKLPDCVADCVICDPPYNIGKDFGNDSDSQVMGSYLIWCDAWIAECLRILKPRGTLFIYGFSENLAYIRTRLSCNVRWIIWHYTNKVVPSSNFWQRTHESILCCSKEKPNFNRDDVREPYTQSFLKGAAGKVRKATVGRFSQGTKETTYLAHAGGALPRDVIKMDFEDLPKEKENNEGLVPDVIKIPALAGGAGKKERVNHPTQKPLALCEKLLKSCLNKNATTLVVVPFVGSGSECLAAHVLGLHYIGYELNPDYVDLARQRILSHTL